MELLIVGLGLLHEMMFTCFTTTSIQLTFFRGTPETLEENIRLNHKNTIQPKD